MEDHEARIIELETRAVYQDQTIAALDEVVREFADRVQRLEAHVKRLEGSLEDLRDRSPANDPPPHY